MFLFGSAAIGSKPADRLLILLARLGRLIIQAAVGFTVDDELRRLEQRRRDIIGAAREDIRHLVELPHLRRHHLGAVVLLAVEVIFANT